MKSLYIDRRAYRYIKVYASWSHWQIIGNTRRKLWKNIDDLVGMLTILEVTL